MTPFLCVLATTLTTQPLLELEPTPTQPAPACASTFEPGALAASAPSLVPAPEDFPEMEYTYVEANYVWTDSDISNDDLNGFELVGSLELPANFFVQGSVLNQDADADVTAYKLGAGWHFGLIPRLDAYGILSFVHVEVNNSNNDFNDDGTAAEVGLRFSLTRAIELNGRLEWIDVNESNSGGGVGVRYYLTEAFSLGARYDDVGDQKTAAAGARFEF